MGMQPITWLGLGYNVPVNPSKNRVYVWRKLKDFGAGYFKQGVAILPKSPQNMAKFNSLAAKIREMGGDATLVELRFVEPRDEAETVERFQRQSENEYQELIRDCATLVGSPAPWRTWPPGWTSWWAIWPMSPTRLPGSCGVFWTCDMISIIHAAVKAR